MTLHSDLSRLIHGQFDKHGISYDRSMPLHRLTARYFEMSMRRIQPGPRRVNFSVTRPTPRWANSRGEERTTLPPGTHTVLGALQNPWVKVADIDG